MNSTRSNRSKDRQLAARRKAQHRLRFETLEDRRLLAVDLHLLKDINTLPEGFGSIPTEIIQVGTTIFFSAETSTQGRELWKTDGTANGTALVKDINIGSNGSNPRHLTNVNGTLYFQANDGTSGIELWKSDGTQAGTARVKDISADVAFGSDPRDLINVNGVLFFRADDGTNGSELWKSNGTELGTVRVKDIRPGSSGSLGQFAYSLTNVNGILFFEANDGTSGNELWKSNGTENGTVRVKDISLGSSNPGGLINVNGTLFFQANDGTSGVELWRSDGSAGGTFRVMDINNGSGSSAPSEFANVNGTLFFRANGGLWKSNGIESGTVPVGTVISPRGLVNVNGTVFFRGFGAGGYELWKSNGSDAGTVLVKDISGAGSSNPGILTNVNGTLYFTASDGVFGSELWKSDGTDLGTVKVKEINSNAFQGAYPVALTNVNGTLFFSANDGTSGTELWRSNGTNNGTTRVKDIKITNRDSVPTDFVNVNGTMFFVANDGTSGYELWKSDGTLNGTVRVKDIRPGSIGSNIFGSDPTFLTNVNGTLFFAANDGTSGLELWKSDGTEIGTVRVKDIRPGDKYSSSLSIFNSEFVNLNGTLLFVANDGTTGNELWKSDGTELGTVRVKDILLGSNSSGISELTNVDGKLFFSANDGTNGFELWISNGTDATTARVKDIQSGTASSNPSYLTNVNNTLFFVANDGTTGNELWRSDGTNIGTKLVKDIIPGMPGAVVSPRYLTNVNGTLFFRADLDFFDSELWKSDGTTLGTVQVKDIRLGSEGSYPRDLVNVNGTLVFVADDGSSGNELWRSDGTTNGTFRLKDIRPGVLSPNPSYMTVVNGALFLQANDGIHGQEMWQSDGTVNGTLLASDLVPGSGGGNPRNFAGINDKILVAASTEVNGMELFIGELTGTGGSASLSVTATSANKSEGNAGTTSFTFTVTRTGALTNATTVNYTVTGVGASPAAASDFVGSAFPNGTVTFAAGQATRVISVPVRGETTFEANEGFRVTLSSPSGGATISTATASGLILNDDTSLAIAATNADKSEGNTGATAFTFTVTRSGVLTNATSVNYAVTGIGANPATAIDFVSSVFPSGVVTFAAGQATRVITISVRGDTTLEADENFRVTLSGASGGATIATAAALGLIRNDETSLAIAATNASKNEGNAGTTVFSFTVSRSGLLTSATTVNYAVTGLGTNPTTADDFVGNILPSGVVTFAAGQASRVISILVRGDTIVEANENFRVSLSSPSGGATLAIASAVGLIRNDDSSLAIAPLSANKNEGLSGVTLFTFTVTRSGSLTEISTVNYAVTGLGANSATAADFSGNVLPSGTVTFAAGEATKVISIVVRGDATVEADEGFRVTLSGASLGTSITTALASGLIRNDDV